MTLNDSSLISNEVNDFKHFPANNSFLQLLVLWSLNYSAYRIFYSLISEKKYFGGSVRPTEENHFIGIFETYLNRYIFYC